MSVIDSYRENLREAQEALDVALTVKDSFKAQGLIKWGTTRGGFTGWLVEGKKADEAYSTWARAQSDVEHWGGLVNEELRKASMAATGRERPASMTVEEVEQRKREIAAQVAARLGERVDADGEATA